MLLRLSEANHDEPVQHLDYKRQLLTLTRKQYMPPCSSFPFKAV